MRPHLYRCIRGHVNARGERTGARGDRGVLKTSITYLFE